MTSVTADRLANWTAGLAAVVSLGAIASTMVAYSRPATPSAVVKIAEVERPTNFISVRLSGVEVK